jgi:hypothetical protein
MPHIEGCARFVGSNGSSSRRTRRKRRRRRREKERMSRCLSFLLVEQEGSEHGRGREGGREGCM